MWRALKAGKLENDPNGQMVLRDFLRLIAGNRIHLGENAADNGELVNHLKDGHVVKRCVVRCPAPQLVKHDLRAFYRRLFVDSVG